MKALKDNQPVAITKEGLANYSEHGIVIQIDKNEAVIRMPRTLLRVNKNTGRGGEYTATPMQFGLCSNCESSFIFDELRQRLDGGRVRCPSCNTAEGIRKFQL